MDEQRFKGVVEDRLFAQGSKSEQTVAHLVTDGGEVLRLKRVGGDHAFRDPNLESLRGKTINAVGRVRNGVLILSDWKQEA